MIMISFIAVLICAMLVNVNSITANAKILETEDKKLTTGRIDGAQKDVNGNTTYVLSGNTTYSLIRSLMTLFRPNFQLL